MKSRISKIALVFALFFSIQMIAPPATHAQCPMCKISAESNLQAGGTAAKGLNTGILYMFATPYLVVGSIAFLWWYYRRQEKEERLTSEAELGKWN